MSQQDLEKFGEGMSQEPNFVQNIIKRALDSCIKDWNCDFKSSKIACLKKVQSGEMLGMHIQKYLAQRMLKLMLSLQHHSVPIQPELHQSFV